MPFGLGAPELILILVIFVLVFGIGRLGDVGAAIGRSIRELRAAIKDEDAINDSRPPTQRRT